jgi:hypothetical protein
MSTKQAPAIEPAKQDPATTHDKLYWGAEAIGRRINRSADQVRYMHASGQLEGYVKKVSHKGLVAAESKLSTFAKD